MADHNLTTPVEYREIPWAPGYKFGSDGSAWSCRYGGAQRGGTNVKPGVWRRVGNKTNSLGYPMLAIPVDGVFREYRLPRLILEAFVGPAPEGAYALHGDGCPANNAISNLRWGTQKENAADTIAHGKTPRGERVAGSKLSEGDVREIRRKLNGSGRVNVSAIAREYGVNPQTIADIRDHKTWLHVTD